eukprot:1161100-Pelagomonas_calceolata.AAC.1
MRSVLQHGAGGTMYALQESTHPVSALGLESTDEGAFTGSERVGIPWRCLHGHAHPQHLLPACIKGLHLARLMVWDLEHTVSKCVVSTGNSSGE